MSNLAPELVYRRNLPHIQVPGGRTSSPFDWPAPSRRTCSALLHAEAEHALSELEAMPPCPERTERLYLEKRRFFGRWDAFLDQGKGPDWLRNPVIAKLMADAVRFHDGKRYDLLVVLHHVEPCACCLHSTAEDRGGVLPVGADHAHDQGLHGGTGQSASRRSGAFWLHETYDHCLRGVTELERIVAYVVNNPVKPAWWRSGRLALDILRETQARGL